MHDGDIITELHSGRERESVFRVALKPGAHENPGTASARMIFYGSLPIRREPAGYKSYTAEPFVRARILELTYYIQSIQQ